MDINRANLEALFSGFKSNFLTGFEQAPDTWQRFAAPVQSGTASNVYPFLEQFGGTYKRGNGNAAARDSPRKYPT